jgi:SAM-dependent methyltransferase
VDLSGAFNQRQRDQWVAMQAAAVPAGSRVLDVGAGKGRYRSLFAHCDYKAQDFAQEPSTIGQYTALDYESDITAIPVADGSFDVILCTEVLEHVPEPIQAVQEMARILKPGGKLLLTAPLGAFLHQEPYHFYGGYTPHWYRRFLPLARFEVISIERNRGFFSWFGQESRRFHALIDPRRTWRTGWRWPLLTLLWTLTLPFCRLLLPAVAAYLDTLVLEEIATIGYHVVGTRLSG